MLRQIEVATIVHAFDLLEPERASEIELHVERRAGVVRQLLFRVFVELQPVLGETEAAVPGHSLLLPVVEPLHVGAGLDKKLHLHLLEFARAENEVAGRYLVAKCLPDLRDSERHLLPRRLLNVQKVDVDALRGLGAEIHHRCRVLNRSHERLEHQVEQTRLAERSFHPARRALRIGRSGYSLYTWIVGPEPLLAVLAIHERIDESADVPARLPDARMHQDRRIEPLDIVPCAHHRVPPPILEVPFELDAERTVVPH